MAFSSWTRAASSSPEASREAEKTPRATDTFEKEQIPPPLPAGATRLGGYRRPSEAGKSPNLRASKPLCPIVVESSEGEGESWAAW